MINLTPDTSRSSIIVEGECRLAALLFKALTSTVGIQHQGHEQRSDNGSGEWEDQ